MQILKLDRVSLSYGVHNLLDGVDFGLRKGDRVGLLGRNGAGKSTLLKVLSGELIPESGERWLRDSASCAYLDQSLPEAADCSVYDFVAGGLDEIGKLLIRYHDCIINDDMSALARVQQELENLDGWRLQQRVDTVISQLHLPGEQMMAELSGGWRRRVALGRALVREPDVLLLDEPTNHLDIPTIEWLESQLASYGGALVFITHDRSFLSNLANRIAELDRGGLLNWDGDYPGFLRHREQQQNAEERANALFDKRLAEEERWIRQGIKARRTRNEGRVRALKAMRVERSRRRERLGRAEFAIEEAERSGKRVAELEGVSKNYGDKLVLREFSALISRGDRVGIIGPNGAGKSTLLKMLLGELAPDSGTVKMGSNLDIAYFDQLRGEMAADKDLIDNVCGGQQFIEINSKRRHAMSYLGDFLFAPERVRTPFKALSGGEQNRAILAKLFSRPANLLVLDEPTNDLDVETLELLEEVLLDFSGTLLLVSHDRAFMDNVVTSLLVLRGDGTVEDHVGGYSEWVAKGNQLASTLQGVDGPTRVTNSSTTERSAKKASREKGGRDKPKLSYKLKRELEALPGEIESLEQKIAILEEQISAVNFFDQDFAVTDGVLKNLSEQQVLLEQAYERWAELEQQT